MYRFTALVVVIALCNSLACGNHTQVPPAKAGDEPRVRILVPLTEISPFSRFNDSKQFTQLEWPKSKLREDVSDTITSFEQLKGRSSRQYKLRPNEPIYQNDLADNRDDEDGRGPQNGEVFHALRFSPANYPVGFFKPGDSVDIQASVISSVPGEPIKTFFILENIDVLAVDDSARHASDGGTGSYRLLLRLSRPQSLMLKNFNDTAKVDLVRRKKGDPQRVKEFFNLSPERIASIAPAATTEQQVLDRWLGNWQTTYKQLKPEEKSGTAETLTTRVIGGQFVQEATAHSDKTFSRSTITYDAEKETYRSWWFSSTGQTDESTGTWDADQKTMTWRSTGTTDVSTTMKQQFKDNDTIAFDVVTKDRSGKVLFHMEGKRVRVKAIK